MLSLSATLVLRVVYMNPVPADDTSLAMTTLLCGHEANNRKMSKLVSAAALPLFFRG